MATKQSRRALGAGFLIASLLGLTLPAQAGIPSSSYASTGDKTSVPYGWVDFCNRYAPECDGPVLEAADVDLTSKTWFDVLRVNQKVNGAIEAVTDMDHWGVVDRWDYPTDGRGDCEDYALLKRKLLMEAGLPRQALLITVVRDHQGEGHAVLTLKTNRGDFILDNLTDKVRPWTETGYKYVKRQSQQDPNAWLSIGVPASDPLFTAR